MNDMKTRILDIKKKIVQLTCLSTILSPLLWGGVGGGLLLTSCEDWLDVSPKSQIKEGDQFSREGGYKDQLTGVYTQMTTQSLYGLNLGIGFAEVLTQNYDVDPNGEWRYAANYDYTQSSVEQTLQQTWSAAYNCIANLNILIRNIDKADSTMFTDNNYYLYRGEAYGLRAFLHLDLMRLFAAAPAMDRNAKGVPYYTEYSTEVVPQKSVGETMQLIINDLLVAHDMLSHDSLKISYSPYYQRNLRIPYFNYYAATLTLARAYLWNGDTENALRYANEIVDVIESNLYSSPFSWVHYTEMTSANLHEVNRLFTSEHLFRLPIRKWEDTGNYYFKSQGGSSSLSPSDLKAQDIYELGLGYGNDYRFLRGFEQDGEKRYMCKFWHIDGSSINDIYPVLRFTEAFYIAAEAQKQSNPARAIELLNTVRANRNLDAFALPETLTADQIQEEIFKEYRKEFLGEGGQLFFYYKRLNAPEIKGASVRPGKSVYVLPIPSNDQEFGGYTN